MRYDPSRLALYSPESGEPTSDFSSSWPVEWICAELSRLAYYRFEAGDGPRLERALVRAGFSPPEAFNVPGSDAQAFGTRNARGTAFLAFRGTQPDSFLDLLANLRFGFVEWPGGGRVHKGFYAAYESISGAIDAWLTNSPANSLVVTGHSLGAALATLLAAARPGADLVTFGSPRVGDAPFAAAFTGRPVRRYVDCTDRVTTVPPELIGYRHLAGEAYIDRRGILHAPPPPVEAISEDRNTGRWAYRRKYAWQFWRNVLTRDLADHAPVNYLSAALGRREPD